MTHHISRSDTKHAVTKLVHLSMTFTFILSAALNFAIILTPLIAGPWLVHANVDPAALIPVVAVESVNNSNNTLDPAIWSPRTPQPSMATVLNKTTEQTKSDHCLESNGTRVQVHDVDKSFCVHGWPICNTDNQQGLCPEAQQELPNGSSCSLLPSTSAYGCFQKVAFAVPTSCHLSSLKRKMPFV